MPSVAFNRLRFLIVDDNPHIRRILRALLYGFGTREVHEADDGAAGKTLHDRVAHIVARPRKFIRTETYFGPEPRSELEPLGHA